MWNELEKAIGYTFRDKALLRNALTHSSFANENRGSDCPDNERLEFLGDSVLGFVTAEHLFHKFSQWPEGDLTRLRADLVCEGSLARAARSVKLGEFLFLGHGEDHNGGRDRDSILADATESILAAAYLDSGFDAAKGIIERLILRDIPSEKPRNMDFKTAFQELVQREKNQNIHYVLVGESGPDHDKNFEMEVILNGAIVGHGSGSSKKRAEQDAARNAIEKMFPNEI